MGGAGQLPFEGEAPPDDGAPGQDPTEGDAPATAAGDQPSGGPRSFQASAGIQGRQFAEQCDTLLAHQGFELHGRRVLSEVGVEIDQEARSPDGALVWFEYKGSVQGNRPGLRRTDTLKKAIANGALLRSLDEPAPYVVLTSHLPEAGAGAAMLAAALDLGYLADVICLYDPRATARLDRW
ncbi:MAG: hypothetical protein KDA97_00955 [Acidimicrobiales bacterium]|nr:hypothetical protein [Acidimicrobiales bacterium]